MPAPKPEPRVVTVLRAYRDLLEARELDAMRGLASSWLTVEKRLDADILALAVEMERRKRNGETITQQILWREERYKVLKAKMQDEVKRWNGESLIPAVEQQQRQFGWLGIDAAKDAIYASFDELSAPLFPVLNRAAVETMVGYLGNGAPLNSLLKQDYPDALDGLSKALINGVARGLGPGAIAREMADGLGMGLERAMLISRTEILRTYRSANVQAYRESRVVSGFKRLVKKETACIACLMLDGQTFDVAAELSDHPRGKCIAVPAVKGAAGPKWQTGPEWFKGLSPDEQREKMGGERYDLWKSGAFDLSALAKMSHSTEWGDSPRVASITELGG